ncbi:MAG: hypothetical protein AB9858_05065 [Acidaminococcaceae bacterium]
MNEKELYFDGDVDLRTVPVDKVSTLTDEGLEKYFELVAAERKNRFWSKLKSKLSTIWEKSKIGGARVKDIVLTAAGIALLIHVFKEIQK